MRLLALAMLGFMLNPLLAADDYTFGPDSMEQAGVPKGKVIKMEPWKSKVFAGTVRDCWVYVPAQYDAEDAGLRHGLSGRRQLRERQGPVPRARSCSTT